MLKAAAEIPTARPWAGLGLQRRLARDLRALLDSRTGALTLPAAVPERYQGVWRRAVLEQDGQIDIRSQIYWLQTFRWHADLRIPSNRPDFSGIASLADCDADQLAWLATQQGFAGITEVRGARCTWRRQMDYQPDNGRRDIGQMAFNNERLIETGVESDYLEIWQRLPDSQGESAVLELVSEAGRSPTRRAWLLVAGDFFIYVRARAESLPPAASLTALIAGRQVPRSQLIDWLDCEISFGQRRGPSAWRIELSTLPFREGQFLTQPGAIQRMGYQIAIEGNNERRWLILDWHLRSL